MRKLLLASAAMLGGMMGLANVASAQLMTVYPNGGYEPPAGTTVNPALGGPGAVGTAIPGWGPPASPGSVTVRLAGRLTAYMGAGSDSGQNPGNVTTFSSATGRNTTAPSNTKTGQFNVFEYARLYPSFDGIAANGLKYGAFLEIRSDGGGAPGGGANGSVSGAVQTRAPLYFRRETAYLGTDQAGFVRYGATDGAAVLFLTGTMENFDNGGWNGDPNMINANAQPTWPFADVGNLYTPNKVVYVSPKFFDLVDFGVSFAPGTQNVNAGGCGSGYANTSSGSGCDMTSSTSFVNENKRLRNELEAVVRVRSAVGPVGLAGTLGTIQSGTVQYNGTVPNVVRYDGISLADVGLQATYGGLAVGGHFMGGKFNGQWQPSPKGADTSYAWITGASYTFGSVVVGGHFFDYQSPGAQGVGNLSNGTYSGFGIGQRSEYGVAVGSTLTLAPGAYVFLSYLYGHRHQNGYDFLGGGMSTETQTVTTHNNVQGQALFLGTQFRW